MDMSRIGEPLTGTAVDAVNQQRAILALATGLHKIAARGQVASLKPLDLGAQALQEVTGYILSEAEPFFVSTEITEALEAAAPILPEWSFRQEMLLAPSCFFWFARPLALPGLAEGLRAVATRLVDTHLILVFYEDDATGQLGVWADPTTGWTIPTEMFLDPMRSFAEREGSIKTGNTGGRTREQKELMLAYLGTTLLFVEQRIGEVGRQRANRATRRRQPDLADRLLRIIRLRRVGGEHHEHLALRDWRFRWIVRGHWRQQFYASNHSHRPTWIAPYLKGPEGKPMKRPSTRLFEVVR